MIAYYEFTQALHDHFIADEDVNTVTEGRDDDIDSGKQTIFPLVNFMVSDAQRILGIWRMTVNIKLIDIVDINNDDLPKDINSWKGHANKQDVLNTMLGVGENFDKELQQGTLNDLGYELNGDIVWNRAEDLGKNLLTGWQTTITVDVPNTIQNCV